MAADVKSADGKSAPGASEVAIDKDTNTFIDQLIVPTHQEVLFRGWVKLAVETAEPKERLLLVTNFRVIVLKNGRFGGKEVKSSYNLLELKELASTKHAEPKLNLLFTVSGEGKDSKTESISIQHHRWQDLAHLLLFSYKSISFGRPQATIALPQDVMDSFMPPEPDVQDGLLATYLAKCNHVEIPQRMRVLDYLMTCFQTEDKTFELGAVLDFLKEPSPPDVVALCTALMYTGWFNEIVANDFKNLGPGGIIALAPLFSVPSPITKAVFVNVGGTKAAFEALAKVLAKGMHILQYLNVSKNPIGDVGIQALAEGLLQGEKVLETLCLSACDFSSKGFKSLVPMLTNNYWMKDLKVLDVSDNKAGSDGTKALADWLAKEAVTLEQLYVMRCGLDLEVLMNAVANNKKLCKQYLHTLDISGNKITKSVIPILASLLQFSSSLANVYLRQLALSKEWFSQLVDAALSNANPGCKFLLDFTGNDLGPKGAVELLKLFQGWMKKDPNKVTKSGIIQNLILNENNLGSDGIARVCEALTNTSITSLSLDRNISLGIFSSGKEAAEGLAKFINATPALKEFSIQGDSNHYLKENLQPLLKALEQNKSITHIDFSHNRIGDDGMRVFSAMLKLNKTLTSFNGENNKITMPGLRSLHEAVMQNTVLTDWVIPMHDIEKVFKKSNVKDVRELRAFVRDFEIQMDNNEQLKSPKKDVDVKSSSDGKTDLKVDELNTDDLDNQIRELQGGNRTRASTTLNTYKSIRSKPKHRTEGSRKFDSLLFASNFDLSADDDKKTPAPVIDPKTGKPIEGAATAGATPGGTSGSGGAQPPITNTKDVDFDDDDEDDDDDDDEEDEKKTTVKGSGSVSVSGAPPLPTNVPPLPTNLPPMQNLPPPPIMPVMPVSPVPVPVLVPVATTTPQQRPPIVVPPPGTGAGAAPSSPPISIAPVPMLPTFVAAAPLSPITLPSNTANGIPPPPPPAGLPPPIAGGAGVPPPPANPPPPVSMFAPPPSVMMPPLPPGPPPPMMIVTPPPSTAAGGAGVPPPPAGGATTPKSTNTIAIQRATPSTSSGGPPTPGGLPVPGGNRLPSGSVGTMVVHRPANGAAPTTPTNAAGLPPPPPALPTTPKAGASPAVGGGSAAAGAPPPPKYDDWQTKTYSLAQLKSSTVPPGVDPTHRELYLPEEEFVKLFGCKKTEYAMMLAWKQKQVRERANTGIPPPPQ